MMKRAGDRKKRNAENIENFVGRMQQFVFNGNHFFEIAHSGKSSNIKTNAVFEKPVSRVSHPVMFQTSAAFLVTPLRLYDTFTMYFQLKTTQANGMILYSGGKHDFLALELADGHLRYIFNVGNGPRAVLADTKVRINDNRWHDIAVVRPALNQHILRVDDTASFDYLPDMKHAVRFNMHDQLYIGGMRDSMYDGLPKQVRARRGFQGCLASVDLDGKVQDLLQHASEIPDQYRNVIVKGCRGKLHSLLCSVLVRCGGSVVRTPDC